LAFAEGLFLFINYFTEKEGFLKDLSNYLIRINFNLKKILGVKKCLKFL